MATRQQELDRIEKSTKDNAQSIQTQQLLLEENSNHVKNLQIQMAEICTQLREMKKLMLHNNRGNDQRLVRLGRLDFPKFNGEDVEGWLYKCDHFFSMDKTRSNLKAYFAVVNLEGPALQWHQGFMSSQNRVIEDIVWEDYARSILNRFSTRLSENPIEDLKNLQQTGTLQDYCEAFDALLNKVQLCESYAAGLFIAGLKPEIRCLVKIFKPQTIRDVISMAKQQEVVYSTLFGSKDVRKLNPIPMNKIGANDEEEESTPEEVINVQEMTMDPQIPIHVINGVPSFNTMRVIGTI
ncbi:uncharacterized protein LOC143550772 [Bidens hawaiensis]|uniref:uncharacterized protein LOC143550772 n=1 Tax=Bidens hawaiensis TaxID=980011 RepID=UPI00404919E3